MAQSINVRSLSDNNIIIVQDSVLEIVKTTPCDKEIVMTETETNILSSLELDYIATRVACSAVGVKLTPEIYKTMKNDLTEDQELFLAQFDTNPDSKEEYVYMENNYFAGLHEVRADDFIENEALRRLWEIHKILLGMGLSHFSSIEDPILGTMLIPHWKWKERMLRTIGNKTLDVVQRDQYEVLQRRVENASGESKGFTKLRKEYRKEMMRLTIKSLTGEIDHLGKRKVETKLIITPLNNNPSWAQLVYKRKDGSYMYPEFIQWMEDTGIKSVWDYVMALGYSKEELKTYKAWILGRDTKELPELSQMSDPWYFRPITIRNKDGKEIQAFDDGAGMIHTDQGWTPEHVLSIRFRAEKDWHEDALAEVYDGAGEIHEPVDADPKAAFEKRLEERKLFRMSYFRRDNEVVTLQDMNGYYRKMLAVGLCRGEKPTTKFRYLPLVLEDQIKTFQATTDDKEMMLAQCWIAILWKVYQTYVSDAGWHGNANLYDVAKVGDKYLWYRRFHVSFEDNEVLMQYLAPEIGATTLDLCLTSTVSEEDLAPGTAGYQHMRDLAKLRREKREYNLQILEDRKAQARLRKLSGNIKLS